MDFDSNDPNWSYRKHLDHDYCSLPSEDHLPSCYSHPNSIDAWRHRRMLNNVLPLLNFYPDATWLTIGDGRFGSDAYYLKNNGADVLATSLSDATLSIAEELGFIDKFKAENAESLSLPDGSHDFVLCKESYHHFPRPTIALYEMIRVSNRAVILLEPKECSNRILNILKDSFKKYIRKDSSTLFEKAGNYIYRLNIKEIVKLMTALNYPAIAYKELNDFYYPKFSLKNYSHFSLCTFITRIGILSQDILCALRLLDYGLICAIAFKKQPSHALIRNLKQNGYRFMKLAENPYL